MRDSINIGKGMDRIEIININDSFDKPQLVYRKDIFIGEKEYILNQWQVQGLIDLINVYLKSELTFEKRETSRLQRKLKELRSLQKNIQLQLSQDKRGKE